VITSPTEDAHDMRERFIQVMAELDLTGEGPDAETFVDGHADAVARAHEVATKALLRLKPTPLPSAGVVGSAHDDLQSVVGAAGRSGHGLIAGERVGQG